MGRRSLRTLGDAGSPHPAAGGGSRIHTYKQLLQPNILRVCGLLREACCVFVEREEPSLFKSHARHGFGPLTTSVAWCVT
jgi:hypothetical protein